MPYLCTNKNLILLYGTENKEIKEDKIAPRRYRSAGNRSDSVSSHCGYIVDNLRQQDSVLGFCCCVRYSLWYRAQLLPMPDQIPERGRYRETRGSSCRRQDRGDRGSGECTLLQRQATDDFHLHEPLERTCQLVSGGWQGEVREARGRKVHEGMAA